MFETNPPSVRTALRVLLIVLVVVFGVIIYTYGWHKTDISLDEVQDPSRTSSVQRALSELFAPNIFDRDLTIHDTKFDVPFGCPDGANPTDRLELPSDHSGSEPYISMPGCVEQDQAIVVEGHNFHKGAFAEMQLVREGGQNIPFDRITTNRANAGSRFDINDEGDFSVEVKVPRGRGLADTTQQVQVRSAWYTGWPYFSKTSKDVIDKMIETIFLALMATTLAVPISVVLSFTSARNLMKQVGLPLGTVLIGFILMPVGAALGYVLLGPLGEWGVKLGEDVPVLGLLEIAAAITAFLLTSRRLNQIKLPHESPLIRVRAFVISILLLAVIIVVTGILGGLGLWVGKELSGDKITLGDHHFSLPTYLAEFCKTIGKLIDMTIIGIAALGGGFLVGSAAATTAAGLLRTVRGPISHVLGAVLGFLSGVILMAIVAYIGAQAVLLGLLTILILGLLGAQVMVLLFRDLVGINKPRRDETRTDQLIRSILGGGVHSDGGDCRVHPGSVAHRGRAQTLGGGMDDPGHQRARLHRSGGADGRHSGRAGGWTIGHVYHLPAGHGSL